MRALVLPGMDGTGTLLTEFAARLSPEFGTEIVRYPGTAPTTYEALFDFVQPVVAAQREWLLIGESFSGPLAIRIAASRPSGLKGLVLCASFASSPHPWSWPLASLLSLPLPKPPTSWLMPWMMGDHKTPEWSVRVASAIAPLPASTVRKRLAGVLRVDVRRFLDSIECPVLYLQAQHDRLVPERCWRDIESRVPNAQCVRLEGPHFILQHQPALAANAIKHFFLP